MDRIRFYRKLGEKQKEIDGREEINVGLVTRVMGKMQPDSRNGPEDFLVTQALKGLLVETIYQITKGFQRSIPNFLLSLRCRV